jgi:hypothetical protein
MVRFLKATGRGGKALSIELGLPISTVQKWLGEPPGLPSMARLKLLEEKYGAQ